MRCLGGVELLSGAVWIGGVVVIVVCLFSSIFGFVARAGLDTGPFLCVLGGARRDDVRYEGRQLGFSRQEACIRWLGVPGMLWSRMVPEVHRFA